MALTREPILTLSSPRSQHTTHTQCQLKCIITLRASQHRIYPLCVCVVYRCRHGAVQSYKIEYVKWKCAFACRTVADNTNALSPAQYEPTPQSTFSHLTLTGCLSILYRDRIACRIKREREWEENHELFFSLKSNNWTSVVLKCSHALQLNFCIFSILQMQTHTHVLFKFKILYGIILFS